jgi:signal peptide peptidase SppA
MTRRSTSNGIYACLPQPLQTALKAAQATPVPTASALGVGVAREYQVIGGTAVIDVSALLEKGQTVLTILGFASDYLEIASQVQAAAADQDITSILLRIDSPGGHTSGCNDCASRIREAAAIKPVFAYCEDLCASAAYWLASQATKIYSNDTALVGSIGTYMVIADMSGLASDLGIKVHVIRAGEFKGAGQDGTVITDSELAEFQRTVDSLNAHFLEGVAAGRRMSLSAVTKLADGRVHVGRDAVTLGLIDGVKSFDDVLAELQASAPRRTTPAITRLPAAVAEVPAPMTSAPVVNTHSHDEVNRIIRREMRNGRSRSRAIEAARAEVPYMFGEWERAQSMAAPTAGPKPIIDRKRVIRQFLDLVSRHVSAGLPRNKAVIVAARENKTLYAQYREATQ